jgi:CRISPR-associated protein Cas5 subtype I-B
MEGLIGAILGLSSDEYPELLKETKIAVQILSEVRKMNLKEKNIHPDWLDKIPSYLENKGVSKIPSFSVPASIEILVNPKYRIYFDGGEINPKLLRFLSSKSTHYTPYLGSSSMICSTRFVSEANYAKTDEKRVIISSIVPFFDEIPRIDLTPDTKFAIEEGLPIHIDKDRNPMGTYKIVYSPNAGKIPIEEGNDVYSVNVGNEIVHVKFLPTSVTS